MTPLILGRAALAEPEVAREAIISEDGAFILVDKPYGETSFHVVNMIRRPIRVATGIKGVKVGHAGTLDPLATGLLIIASRRKTKGLTELLGLEKTYLLRMRFGITTPSFDLERPLEIIGGEDKLTPDSVRAAIEALPGEHDQMPPIFSAIKQHGHAVYLKARKGKEVILATRPVMIHSAEVVDISLPFATFRVRVSKGTYIRSIVRDIAESLGTGGVLVDLVRESIAEWQLEDALRLEEAVNLLSNHE